MAKVLKISRRQVGSSDIEWDMKLRALPPGRRRAKSGKTYWETRKNRSDKPGTRI